MNIVAGRRSRSRPAERVERVVPYIALITFPVIFLGELPDKTMFANILMATRGRPSRVWLGSAMAFFVHVVIATTVGVALFAFLPHQAIDAVVAALFLFGAVYAWRLSDSEQQRPITKGAPRHGVVLTAFVVIFLAEWGDLTQILTANLAAHYHSSLSVAVGAIAALWAVAALAVAGGQVLVRRLNMVIVRRLTSVVLVALAVYTTWSAIH